MSTSITRLLFALMTCVVAAPAIARDVPSGESRPPDASGSGPRRVILACILVDDLGRPLPMSKALDVGAQRRSLRPNFDPGLAIEFIDGGASGRFIVYSTGTPLPSGTPIEIVVRRKNTNARHVVGVVIDEDPEPKRIVVPRRAMPLTGRIDLAGLDAKELFVYAAKPRRSDHCALPSVSDESSDRVFGVIKEDGSYVVHEAPTGRVTMVVGAGRIVDDFRPGRVGDDSVLLRIEDLLLSADEPCRDPRATDLSLAGRFVEARVFVMHGEDRPAIGVSARVEGGGAVEFRSEQAVLRLVATRFPIEVELRDESNHRNAFGYPNPRFGSAVVSITGDAEVRLPTVVRVRFELAEEQEPARLGTELKPMLYVSDGRLILSPLDLSDLDGHTFVLVESKTYRLWWIPEESRSAADRRVQITFMNLPAQEFRVTRELNGATVRLSPPPDVIAAVKAALKPR